MTKHVQRKVQEKVTDTQSGNGNNELTFANLILENCLTNHKESEKNIYVNIPETLPPDKKKKLTDYLTVIADATEYKSKNNIPQALIKSIQESFPDYILKLTETTHRREKAEVIRIHSAIKNLDELYFKLHSGMALEFNEILKSEDVLRFIPPNQKPKNDPLKILDVGHLKQQLQFHKLAVGIWLENYTDCRGKPKLEAVEDLCEKLFKIFDEHYDCKKRFADNSKKMGIGKKGKEAKVKMTSFVDATLHFFKINPPNYKIFEEISSKFIRSRIL